ncbi:MAG: DUF4126 family protein [Ktedonobacteraceae bacterium]
MSELHLNRLTTLFSTSTEPLDLSDEGSPANVYARAATLGFVAGLRSMTPLAWLSRTSQRDPEPANAVEEMLDSPAARIVTSMLASGELIGDKLPVIPSRLKPGPLTGRLLIGGLVGMRICRRYHQSLVVGAILGAASAAAGSYAGNFARTRLAENTKIPKFVPGLAEDGLAMGLAWLAVRDK